MTDLISRAEAMNKCKNAENELTDEADRKGLRVARFIIGEMPSADAVQGEWVYGTDPITGEKDCIAWTCSLCGGKYPWQPNYCPNCGARMKGGAE